MANQTISPFCNARILIVGDIMLDRYWFGSVQRISPEAPVPIAKLSRTEEKIGGAGNVAANVASLGAQAALLCITGQDQEGETLSRLISETPIQYYPILDPTLRTTTKLRVISQGQQLIRIDTEETPHISSTYALSKQYLALFQSYDVVIFSDYNKGSLLQVQEMLSASQGQCLSLIDPKGNDFSKYNHATCLTPNFSEFTQMVGRCADEELLCQKAQKLRRELSLEYLLVTRSEDGMTLFGPDIPYHHQPCENTRTLFDVSGAGDTVIATLAAMLATGYSWQQSVALANYAAGITIGRLGVSTIHFHEIKSMLTALST